MADEDGIRVRVALRARPLIEREKSERARECLRFVPNEPQVIVGKDRGFTYDYVFSPIASQQDLYDNCCRELIDRYVTTVKEENQID